MIILYIQSPINPVPTASGRCVADVTLAVDLICNRKTNFFFSTLYKNISFQPYHLAVNPAPSLQTECGPAYLEPLAPGCLIAAPVSWTEAAAGHRSQVTFSANFASTGADDKCRKFYPIICFPLSRISPSSPSSGQLHPAWLMIRMERVGVGELIRSSKLYQDQDIQTSRHNWP